MTSRCKNNPIHLYNSIHLSFITSSKQELVKVSIPVGFTEERTYAISVILGHFLGLEFEVLIDETINHYKFDCCTGQIKMTDAFFGMFDTDYLSKENIPQSSYSSQNQYSNRFEVLFGSEAISKTGNHITCETDLVASTFFMLSRWEEYCIPKKDEHGRTVERELFSVKHNLHHRPLVNEWVELLWNMLQEAGCSQNRKQYKFDIRITHDVDHIARYDSLKKFIRALGGDLFLRKNPVLMLNTLKDFFAIRFGLKKDNYDTTDWLMDVSERYNTKSHFYFIPSAKGENDARYDISSPRIKEIITNIESRDHIVGIHPSYNTFKNPGQFKDEVERIQKVAKTIKEGRQHYLRFSNPETWNMWNDTQLTHDSTIGFALDIGFRAGVCYDYPVFDVIQRKQLNLIERPLIIMEGPLVNTFGGGESSMKAAQNVIDQCKKFNGEFVFLWHPENFNHTLWKPHVWLYESIIQYALNVK